MGRHDIEKHQFKPGRSGNPKGRPKKLPELQRLLADGMADELPAIITRLVSMAKAGNLKAAELLLGYAYGKPRQANDLHISTGEGEGGMMMSGEIRIMPKPPKHTGG